MPKVHQNTKCDCALRLRRFCVQLSLLLGSLTAAALAVEAHAVEAELNSVLASSPTRLTDLTQVTTADLIRSADKFHQACGDLTFQNIGQDGNRATEVVRQLLEAKRDVDTALRRTLALRTELTTIEPDQQQRNAIRQFLSATTTLIDLSGRTRYVLRDAVSRAAHLNARDRKGRLELIELLIDHKSGIGAGVMSVLLEDPPAESPAEPADSFTKAKVLILIAVSQESDLLPAVARLALDEKTSPSLTLMAAQCIERLGLPQDPHPRQAKDLPQPAITAKQLRDRLVQIETEELSSTNLEQHQTLLAWLDERISSGITGDSYKFFGHRVKEGDWFLMRNPSPYNRFTDLSPGLFTHVGVVTTDTDEHGIRRFVIVDLPERGATIPVTNVDTYTLDTLHYFFTRHPDAAVSKAMSETARSMIGNPTQFDLNFNTSRVAQYREGDLQGKKIHTYCAGFLLICALRSGQPPSEFFPIVEQPAPGNTQANLQSLGLSIGKNFVSPTAALFSSEMKIIGMRRPMYDPGRAVEEAIYDHFAQQMRDATLHQSPDAAQALRQKLVAMAEDKPWLKRAIANASGVSEHMDLVSAAKAAAVVETLDEIADGSAEQFLASRSAFDPRTTEQLRAAGVSAEQIAQRQQLRRDHETAYAAWTNRRLRPHQLQRYLVNYYARQGQRKLDERFFTSP